MARPKNCATLKAAYPAGDTYAFETETTRLWCACSGRKCDRTDRDGDGEVSVEEFLRIMKRRIR